MDDSTLLQFLTINFSARDFESRTEQGLLFIDDERWKSVMDYAPDHRNVAEFIQTTIDFVWAPEGIRGSIVRWDYPSNKDWEPDYRISTQWGGVRILKSGTSNEAVMERIESIFVPYKVLFPMHLDLFK